MEHILSSLDMFAGIAENLIDYTFNVSHLVQLSALSADATPDFSKQLASYEMNEVMYVDVLLIPSAHLQAHYRRRLTLATIIFLPLTFLSGYFVSPFPNPTSTPSSPHPLLLSLFRV